MKLSFKIFFILIFSILLIYVIIPAPEFPLPPNDSLQSSEPADLETPLRRSYFTNFTREEVMKHYKDQLSSSAYLGIALPTYSFNYPPEESQTIIRDQTKSTFLEEIVYPFRMSVFISGFEPKTQKEGIFFEDNRTWRQKIIVKYVESYVGVRICIVFLTALVTWFILIELKKFIKELSFKFK
ncbi:MAG: hypothetical protein ABIJ05_02920 [Patescibacteria group bacterium]